MPPPLEKASKSQAAAVSQRAANTEIAVTYSRPVARGRALFGALMPYDKRTAHAATLHDCFGMTCHRRPEQFVRSLFDV